MIKFQSYAKAIVGFLAPGVVALGGALTVSSDGGGHTTQYEWVAAVIACLVTGGFVYAVPNRPAVMLPPVVPGPEDLDLDDPDTGFSQGH